MKQLAILLGNQKTLAKWLVITTSLRLSGNFNRVDGHADGWTQARGLSASVFMAGRIISSKGCKCFSKRSQRATELE